MEIWLGCPEDLPSSLYHSLQAFAVHDGAGLIPHSDAAGQDALCDATVEAAENPQ